MLKSQIQNIAPISQSMSFGFQCSALMLSITLATQDNFHNFLFSQADKNGIWYYQQLTQQKTGNKNNQQNIFRDRSLFLRYPTRKSAINSDASSFQSPSKFSLRVPALSENRNKSSHMQYKQLVTSHLWQELNIDQTSRKTQKSQGIT